MVPPSISTCPSTSTGGKISGSDIVARIASASEPRRMTTGCAERRSTATVRNGVGRSSKSLDVEVRRRDAAEQQLDLLAAVQRGRRHDAAACRPNSSRDG